MTEHKADAGTAWAVVLSDGRTYGRYDTRWEANAIAAALPHNEGVTATVVPLYRSPTLTDAEREAVEHAEWALREIVDATCDKAAATLRGILERLG